jgi:hypothetical protein
MRRYFVVFALVLACFASPAFPQATGQIDSASAVGVWTNTSSSAERLELRPDGQFVLDEQDQHVEGRWELQSKVLVLHLPSGAVATAQWDGGALIDSSQRRWVHGNATALPAKTAPVAASAVPSGTQNASGASKTASLPALTAELNARFKPTKLTADSTDIVTPGTILVLQKDGLLMFSTDTRVPPTSTYKDGKLGMGFGTKVALNIELGQLQQGATSDNVPQRKFVTGEKFWVIFATAKDDGVILRVYSDPYNDTRYYGQLKIPFQKHVIPPVDDVMKTIAEVVTIQPTDDASAGPAQSPVPPSPVPEPIVQTASVPPPITPPPPPADAPAPAPKTISRGQTVAQVVSILGQPQKVVKLGTKEIYSYPDMKVTFVNGKVSDAE